MTILIFGVYLFSDIIYGILFGDLPQSLRRPRSASRGTSSRPGRCIFGQKPPFAYPGYLSFLVLAAICAASAAVLWRRLRSVEEVR